MTSTSVTPVTAGLLTALVAGVGSLSRPAGGILADKVGGAPLLSILLGGVGIAYAICAMLPALPVVVVVLALLMLCLGLGNGAVFQMVPQRFARESASSPASSAPSAASAASSSPTSSARPNATGSFAPGFVRSSRCSPPARWSCCGS